jgi:FG-GAP repeat
MNMRTVICSAVVALLVPVALIGAPSAAVATPAPMSASVRGSGVVGDFNGDGFPDLVVGYVGFNGDDSSAAGYVAILPGTASGQPDADAATRFTCSQFGFGPDGLGGCEFGQSLAVGDFNGDGFSDLAIGIPGITENTNAAPANAVAVLYGGPDGLSLNGDQVWSQRSPGIPGSPIAPNQFGAALAAPDLNGDGRSDLVIGIPGFKQGAVEVLFGGAHGLCTSGSRQIFRAQTKLAGQVSSGWGSQLIAGDYNGDHYGDVVIATPTAAVKGRRRVGRVDVLYGSPQGIKVSGGSTFTPATPGVPGAATTGAYFGRTLTEGDYNGDGYRDLVIGEPLSNGKTGAVTVLYGSRSGLTSRGSQHWTERTQGVPGTPAPLHGPTVNELSGEEFGHTLATLNPPATTPGAAKYAALYIGVPNDLKATRDYEGTVIALQGSRHGLTTTGIKVLKDPDFAQTQESTGWGITIGGGPHIAVSQAILGPPSIKILDDGGAGPYDSTTIPTLYADTLTW